MQLELNSIITSIILFKKLEEYQDIFLIKKVDYLLSYKDNNYIIKITTNPLYSPFYNLLIKKLKVLYTYLNNALAKR